MVSAIKTKVPIRVQPEDEYPSSDGKPMAETEVHIVSILYLLAALRYLFRKQTDVFVIADMLLYYKKGNASKSKAPDVMVVKGVDTSISRRTYKLWEEGVTPSVVIEVTSKSTQQEDIGPKPALYAKLGIKEYFVFDPLDEYVGQQLLGYRIVDGELETIKPDSDGDLHSEELGTILSADGNILRVVDPETGEFIPDLREAMSRVEQEAQRANQAEAEVARLRALLDQPNRNQA
jgi:Uma2 family endonuclease